MLLSIPDNVQQKKAIRIDRPVVVDYSRFYCLAQVGFRCGDLHIPIQSI